MCAISPVFFSILKNEFFNSDHLTRSERPFVVERIKSN